MKIIELLNSIRIPITNEEADIMAKFNESTIIMKSDLEPREQMLANNLVTKDVLARKKNTDGKITYIKKTRD